MSNADYSCQDEIESHHKNFKVPDTATVVGTGGFGAWAAVFLARAGVRRLVLINPAGGPSNKEDVQGREIAIGPFFDRHLGTAKVDALEELLQLTRPNLNIVTHKIYYKPSDSAKLLEGYVFAGVSNTKILQGIFADAKAQMLHCVAGSYFATEIGCYTSYPTQLSIAQNAPVWVGSASMSAQLAVHAAIVSQINYVGNLDELRAPILPISIKHDC